MRERLAHFAERASYRLTRGGKRGAGSLDAFAERGESGLHNLLAAQRAQDVEADDVLGAFPDRVALRVAQLARERPVLDITIAAMDFDGLRSELDPAPAGAQLRDRHQQARERAVVRGGGENQR